MRSASPSGPFFCRLDFLSTEMLAGQSALWLLHGLLAGLAVWLSKRREIDRKSAFRAVSAVAVAGFLVVITLSEQRALDIPDDTLYMWTILAVVLMMSVLVFNISHQYEVENRPSCWSGITLPLTGPMRSMPSCFTTSTTTSVFCGSSSSTRSMGRQSAIWTNYRPSSRT